MDKLNAIRYFCAAADNLNFRETANRFAVSPSVVSRMMNELEDHLGEALFKRSTRSISLTAFGEQFLPQAQQWLADSDKLFRPPAAQNDMAGTVRITAPAWRENDAVLAALLARLAPYPDLLIDWREDMGKLDFVEHRIDIGLRIGLEPDPNFIVRRIARSGDLLIAAPALIERLGQPADLDDLCRRYPFAAEINFATGRPWPFRLNPETTLHPHKINFLSNNSYSVLQAILQGRSVGLASDFLCRSYLKQGRLVEPFPDTDIQKWQLFLYRPYQNATPARVAKVFDVLTEILRQQLAGAE